MVIVLEEIRAGVAFDVPLGPRELERGPLERIAVPAGRLVGTVRPGPRGLELEARLEARLELACSRCLTSYASDLVTPVSLVLVPEAVEFGPSDAQLKDDDAELFYASAGRVEIEHVAVEQIYLNLPLKPLCVPGCRGLCPTCGGNRNRIECACPREAVDPRLLPLRDFKAKLGDG